MNWRSNEGSDVQNSILAEKLSHMERRFSPIIEFGTSEPGFITQHPNEINHVIIPEAPAPNEAAGEKPYCNIVMKGGITSGVVYPRAVAELAEKYRFKNVGGTSAGAIAAGMAAAAEFGRASGGFQRMLDRASQANRILFSLFQPAPCLRPLYRAMLAALGGKPWCLKLAAILIRLVCGYWFTSLVGTALASAAALAACWLVTGQVVWTAFWAAPAGLVLALIWRIRRAVIHDLPQQFFGICPGVTQPGTGHQAGLTDWLADALDEIAGVRSIPERDPDRPLTFGDLHGENPDDPGICLLMMTTNLTEGRPYRVPFEDRKFLFRPDEFRRLFPPRIVDWMIKTSREFDGDSNYRYLPETADLPVIVAVRMSLSFPILLAAVPLHARDFLQPDEREKQRPRPQWFSDGGLSSNFPIHFFDAIWPRWPTFGVKLEAFDPQVHQEQRITLPVKAGQGLLLPFRRVDSLGQFLGSMLEAMQEWRENLQSILPGYRERIVHVRLAAARGRIEPEHAAGDHRPTVRVRPASRPEAARGLRLGRPSLAAIPGGGSPAGRDAGRPPRVVHRVGAWR